MSHVINGVTHNVNDDDGIFEIDISTRQITYKRSGTAEYFDFPVLAKGDHNSERLTFKIPNLIEGHKVSDCNLIRIHYNTIDSETSAQYRDAYDVPASDRIPGDDNFEFTWLIDKYVTQYAGPISFVIQFACVTETQRTGIDENSGEPTSVTVLTTDYSWSTLPYDELTVSYSINNDRQVDEQFKEEYNSILFAWHNEIEEVLGPAAVKMEQTVTSTEDEGENVWTAYNKHNVTVSEFKVRNGSKGSQGLSAYEIANKDGKYASEQEWLDSLKALGYDECLKGVTLTQEDYDSLSEDEKSREDFVYIIKDAEVHADTADHATTADSASFAREYAAGGGIDKALQSKASSDHSHDEITDHEERIKDTEDTLNKIVCESVEVVDITENGSVSIDYTTIVLGINRPEGTYYEISGTPSKTITAPDKCVFTSIEITSCSIANTYSTHSAAISEDGKTITFSIDGEVPTHTGSTQTATIEYSYTYRVEAIDSVYHAQAAERALVAEHLTLAQGEILDISKDGESATGTIYHHALDVSPGRVYLLARHPYYGSSPRYFETAIIYIENHIRPTNTPPPCLSTPFSDGSRVVVYQSESDSLWYAYGIDSEGNRAEIDYVSFIEL